MPPALPEQAAFPALDSVSCVSKHNRAARRSVRAGIALNQTLRRLRKAAALCIGFLDGMIEAYPPTPGAPGTSRLGPWPAGGATGGAII